jgi:carbamoyltransferase
VVAYPYAPIALSRPARWYYARRHWYEPGRALRALYDGNRKVHRNTASVLALLDELGIGSAARDSFRWSITWRTRAARTT